MIDMKKMIVRLLGSCLLCSALTLNCRGDISDRFYDCLTTYTKENAGYSPNAYYSTDDCHGYIDGRWEEGHTVSTPYSKIKKPEKHYSQWRSFVVMNNDHGDYVKNGDYACPLWCSTNDKPIAFWEDNQYGGNDLTYNQKHDSIYIRGLECIGRWAAASSSPLPSIRIRSTPVAIDERAFDMVQGLQKLNFSAVPYYVATNAFPDSVNEIEFHDSGVDKLIGCFTDSEFDKTLKNLALTNRPENECELNKKKTSLYDRVSTWIGFEENEPYTLFNFFKNKREYSIMGPYYIRKDSHLYLVNKDDPNKAYLLWTRTEQPDPTLVDLYWGDYEKVWVPFDTPSTTLAVGSGDTSSVFSGTQTDGSVTVVSDVDTTSDSISISDESIQEESSQEQINEALTNERDNRATGYTGNAVEYSTNRELENTSVDNSFPEQQSTSKLSNSASNTGDSNDTGKNGTTLTQANTSGDYSVPNQQSASKVSNFSSNSGEFKSYEDNSDGSSASLKQEYTSGDTSVPDKQSTSKVSSSASTKTGYSSGLNSFLPMILSGGSVLVLKKKKDD